MRLNDCQINYFLRVVIVVIYMRLIGGKDSRGSVIEILSPNSYEKAY